MINASRGIARILKAEGTAFVSHFPSCKVNNAIGDERDIPLLMMRDERYGVAVADAFSRLSDGKKFGDALSSFSMQSKVQRGDQDATAARISGVPSLAVDGKFLINNEAAGDYVELLKLTDSVIAKARQERKGK